MAVRLCRCSQHRPICFVAAILILHIFTTSKSEASSSPAVISSPKHIQFSDTLEDPNERQISDTILKQSQFKFDATDLESPEDISSINNNHRDATWDTQNNKISQNLIDTFKKSSELEKQQHKGPPPAPSGPPAPTTEQIGEFEDRVFNLGEIEDFFDGFGGDESQLEIKTESPPSPDTRHLYNGE